MVIVESPSSLSSSTTADAAWANRPDGPSNFCRLTKAAQPKILTGIETVSVVAWNSVDIRRVVRSALGAERAASSTRLHHARCFTRDLEVNTESISANACKGLADVFSQGSIGSQINVRTQETRNRSGHDQANFVTAPGPLPINGRMVRMSADILAEGTERSRVDSCCRTSHCRSPPTSEVHERRRNRPPAIPLRRRRSWVCLLFFVHWVVLLLTFSDNLYCQMVLGVLVYQQSDVRALLNFQPSRMYLFT